MNRRALPPALRGHLPVLDGVRGLAVLLVMVFHFFHFSDIAPTHAVGRAAALVASTGWAGVDLFFVLSGYLITGILSDTRERPGYFRTFFARRSLRIFPLYYGVLVAFFIVLPAIAGDNPTVRAETRGQLWLWSYLGNVQTALYGWGASSGFVDHFWSLAVEEQFYLVWPVLVLALSPTAMLRTCGGIVVGSLLLRVWLHSHDLATSAYVLMPARMDALAMGGALALAVRDPRLLALVSRWAKPALLAACALLVTIGLARGTFEKQDAVVGTAGFTLLAVAFAALLVLALLAAPGARVARVFGSRPLRTLGTYSYGLYVFHQPVALLLTWAGGTALLARVGGGALGGQVLYTVLGFAMSMAIAFASWHLYEKHFLALKARFATTPPSPVSETPRPSRELSEAA